MGVENLSERTGVSILLVDDLVDFGGVHNFYPKFSLYRNGPSINIEEAYKNRRAFTNIIKSFIKADKRIFYFDPLPYLCPEKLCTSVIDGQLIYADSSPHFSKSKVSQKLLSEPLRRKLLEISNSNL